VLFIATQYQFIRITWSGKTRLARKMIELLDEYIPFVTGSEINDDRLVQFQDLQRYYATQGDRNAYFMVTFRSFLRKATPDVTVADLIGDIDPIKAANLKYHADDRVIHFGMIPRANRCIFCNELPDLQAEIQVALFTSCKKEIFKLEVLNCECL
jgi:magnesium chelatase subunit I